VINDLVTYLLHIAPSLAVVIVVLFVNMRRLDKLEQEIMGMLDSCWEKLFEHLNSEK
jgi:hypothetical protein